MEYSKLARERNLQSVIKSSSIFQENFVLMGRKKTKFQSQTSLLLIIKFIYIIKSDLNYSWRHTNLFSQSSFFLTNLIPLFVSIWFFHYFSLSRSNWLYDKIIIIFLQQKHLHSLYLLSLATHILVALHTEMLPLSFLVALITYYNF